MTEQEIISGVLTEFEGLAKHPRPSHHEKEVSDYIVARLAELGVKARQDEIYNIIADVPATPGCENVPLTILQGHMDMVCVAKPGVAFDPQKDPIKLVREGNILRADGTSLGADDGIAVAISLYLIQQKIQHGPLRLIFTVDEETNMTGALSLSADHVKDAKYVINCDSESIHVICVASAGSCHMEFTRDLHRCAPTGDTALTVRAHALADYKGGVAANAIPSDASAVVVVAAKDVDRVKATVAAAEKDFNLVYGETDPNAVFEVTPADLPKSVLSAEDTTSIVDVINLLHCGVFAMDRRLPRLPALSASLGTIETREDVLAFQYFPRSSSDARLQALVRVMPIMAKCTGTKVHIEKPFPAWTESKNSKLQALMADAYKDVMGKEPRMEAMHGGLETGFLYAMNPDLDIVSVGPETHDIHSADERVELDTVAQLVQVIAGTLERLTK